MEKRKKVYATAAANKKKLNSSPPSCETKLDGGNNMRKTERLEKTEDNPLGEKNHRRKQKVRFHVFNGFCTVTTD